MPPRRKLRDPQEEIDTAEQGDDDKTRIASAANPPLSTVFDGFACSSILRVAAG